MSLKDYVERRKKKWWKDSDQTSESRNLFKMHRVKENRMTQSAGRTLSYADTYQLLWLYYWTGLYNTGWPQEVNKSVFSSFLSSLQQCFFVLQLKQLGSLLISPLNVSTFVRKMHLRGHPMPNSLFRYWFLLGVIHLVGRLKLGEAKQHFDTENSAVGVGPLGILSWCWSTALSHTINKQVLQRIGKCSNKTTTPTSEPQPHKHNRLTGCH